MSVLSCRSIQKEKRTPPPKKNNPNNPKPTYLKEHLLDIRWQNSSSEWNGRDFLAYVVENKYE